MKTSLPLIIIMFTLFQIQAQIKAITGTILDGDSLPLPGVNVFVKGTDYSTTTDFDGNYKILAEVNDVLIFNYVGSIEQRVVVNTIDTLSFTMREPYLEEVFRTSCGYNRDRFAPQITYQYVTIKFR